MSLQAWLSTAACAAHLCCTAYAQCNVTGSEVNEKLGAVGIVHYEGEALRKPPRPTFPDVALAADTAGDVVLLLIISQAGKVVDRVVLCSEPFGYFEPSLLESVKGFEFSPLAATDPQTLRWQMITSQFRFSSTNNDSRIEPYQ